MNRSNSIGLLINAVISMASSAPRLIPEVVHLVIGPAQEARAPVLLANSDEMIGARLVMSCVRRDRSLTSTAVVSTPPRAAEAREGGANSRISAPTRNRFIDSEASCKLRLAPSSGIYICAIKLSQLSISCKLE